VIASVREVGKGSGRLVRIIVWSGVPTSPRGSRSSGAGGQCLPAL